MSETPTHIHRVVLTLPNVAGGYRPVLTRGLEVDLEGQSFSLIDIDPAALRDTTLNRPPRTEKARDDFTELGQQLLQRTLAEARVRHENLPLSRRELAACVLDPRYVPTTCRQHGCTVTTHQPVSCRSPLVVASSPSQLLPKLTHETFLVGCCGPRNIF